MYTGTLIDDLMKVVERSEKRSLQAHSQERKPMHLYGMAESELVQFESQLVGAA